MMIIAMIIQIKLGIPFGVGLAWVDELADTEIADGVTATDAQYAWLGP
jgi:hypothetical protein